MPLHAQRAQPVNQLHRRRLAHLAIRMADNGDFLAALDGAGQGQRAHCAAQGAADNIARVTQPDELLFGNAQHLGQQRVEPGVNARQCHNRKLALEVRRVQPGVLVAGHCPVIGIYNGFKQAHSSMIRFSTS